jgi:predicted RNase H-like HicB family nuclease
VKSYIFRIELEEDAFEDGRMAYHAYCPALKDRGASTWGYTKQEAIKNIREVVEMTIESMLEDGEGLPEESSAEVSIRSEPIVSVTV